MVLLYCIEPCLDLNGLGFVSHLLGCKTGAYSSLMSRRKILSLLFKCYQDSCTRKSGSSQAPFPEQTTLLQQSVNNFGRIHGIRFFASNKGNSGPSKAVKSRKLAPVFPQNMKPAKGRSVCNPCKLPHCCLILSNCICGIQSLC